MPALMAQRSSSVMLNKIRRELDRRRKAINVANGRVVKRSSSAPPSPPRRLIPSGAAATVKLANSPREGAPRKCSAPLPHRHPRVLIPTGAPGADTKNITYLDMGEAPRRCTHPPRQDAVMIPFPRARSSCPDEAAATKSGAPTAHAPAAATKLSTASSHDTTGAEAEYIKKLSPAPLKKLSPAPLIKKPSIVPMKKPSSAVIKKPSSALISVQKGMTVKVRVPVGTYQPTGQRLIILHPAVVVSEVEDGYVEVIYKGNYPCHQTTRVRITLDQVKIMPPAKR